MHERDVLLKWCLMLWQGFVAAGVRTVVVSPGSRSTPLVLTAIQAGLDVVSIIDERSASFYALGRARVEKYPVVLIRTSGSAGAHDLPAAVEAKAQGLAVISMTADRPVESQYCYDNQTINQIDLLGHQAVGYFQTGIPEATERSYRTIRRLGIQCVTRSMGPVPGMVQLNIALRKPLEPSKELPQEFLASMGSSPRIFAAENKIPSMTGISTLFDDIGASKRILVVAGPNKVLDAQIRQSIYAKLAKLPFPVIAEGTSQFKFGDCSDNFVQLCEPIFRNPQVLAKLKPDLVIQLNRPMISSAWAKVLAAWSDVTLWTFSEDEYADPNSRTSMLQGDVDTTLGFLVNALDSFASFDAEYKNCWQRAGQLAFKAVQEVQLKTKESELTEGKVVSIVKDVLPEGARLCIGNSLVVRHIDLFLPHGGSHIDVVHQRGASGIDGLIAGAIGSSQGAPTLLLLGDVSFWHDVGSLQLRSLAGASFVIVVVNNGGGRIFEQLPIADHAGKTSKTFEYFSTPMVTPIAQIAESFGWDSYACTSSLIFNQLLREIFEQPKSRPCLIEVIVDKHDAAKTMKSIDLVAKNLFQGFQYEY